MSSTRTVTIAALVAVGVLAASALALGAIIAAMNIRLTKLPIYAPENVQFHSLPSRLPVEQPRWKQAAPDEVMSSEAVEELGTSNYITRWYARVSDDPNAKPLVVQLHCAYYTGMTDTVPHVPERCMVGGGMSFGGDTVMVKIPLDMSRYSPDAYAQGEDGGVLWTARSTITHNRVRLPEGIEDLMLRVTPFTNQDGSQKLHAGYFFIANGRVYASANDVRLKAFELDEDYAYYAKIQFMSMGVASPEELALVAKDMLEELLPEVMRRVPDWAEVRAGRYPTNTARDDASGVN